MANLSRKIGLNIYTFMQNNNYTCEKMAEQLNYSVNDLCRVIEGKLMLPPKEINKIALLLGVTAEDVIHHNSDRLVPNLEFMHEFSNPDNLDRVLDLMDEYVELKEAL